MSISFLADYVLGCPGKFSCPGVKFGLLTPALREGFWGGAFSSGKLLKGKILEMASVTLFEGTLSLYLFKLLHNLFTFIYGASFSFTGGPG
jgi:hypothetical protein